MENGEVFFTKCTGYDAILEIAARELETIGDQEFAHWLRNQFPSENEHKGDAVFFNSKNEIISRSLDLSGLTKKNRETFWQALTVGRRNLEHKIEKIGPGC